MSREIKFRAWDKKTERFQSGFHLTSDGKIIFACLVDNEDYILSQFTGLKDKNGKEIFEGDIVNAQYNICSYFKKVCVYFENGCFYVDDKNPKQNLSIGYFFREKKEIEVIGNIFQNPELLGG